MVAKDYGAGKREGGAATKGPREGSWGDGDALYLQRLHPGSDTVGVLQDRTSGKTGDVYVGSLYDFLQLLCVIIWKSKV